MEVSYYVIATWLHERIDLALITQQVMDRNLLIWKRVVHAGHIKWPGVFEVYYRRLDVMINTAIWKDVQWL